MRPDPVVAAILLVASLSAAPPPARSGTPSPVIQQYLTHPGFTWKCRHSAHFQFCFDPKIKSDPNLIAARNGAEEARSHVLSMAGEARYDPRIYVFFLESRARMKALTGFDGEGRSRPTQHAIFFVLTPVRPDLTHELTHEILSNLWGNGEPWIEEGLATYAAQGGFHPEVKEWLADGRILPLEKLANPGWEPSQHSIDITYGELAGFVEYLKNTYGINAIRQVWRGGSASVPKIFGKSVAELEKDWHEALRR
jgi:hypothetical protein